MPNWVTNELKITSDNPELIKAVRAKILTVYNGDDYVGCNGKEYLSFALLIPENLDDPNYRVKAEGASITATDKRADGTIFDWYNYHIDKWGCKWDSAPDEFNLYDDTETSLGMSFTTAWSCPCEWYEKLCEEFPDVSIQLASMDEAMDYYWLNGKKLELSKQFDQKQTMKNEFKRAFEDNDEDPEKYDLDKLADEYEDGSFNYDDYFDPTSWDYTVDADDDFIEFAQNYKKKKPRNKKVKKQEA